MTSSQGSLRASGVADRRIVFISHANPEQNDFTHWLGAQLANAGYEVWSDVTKLIGGEVFWDDIEDAIRNHAAKFVLAVSKSAAAKDGVQDEVAVAVSVERSQKIKNFVVPCRVDDLDFSQFRANVTRKNAIDFSASWADGLRRLLEVLARDKVPVGAVGPSNVRTWLEQRFDPAQLPRSEDETLISNWLSVPKLPSHVSVFDLERDQTGTRALMKDVRVPWFPYFRLVGTFASELDLKHDLPPGTPVKLIYQVPIEDFLKGKPRDLPGMEARTARNHVASMLRQAWDQTLSSRGLSSFEMANGVQAWFFKKGLIEDDKYHFVDHAGKRRKRQVVGRSERRKVYWHLGFRAKPSVGHDTRFCLRAVVLFSEDGVTPIDSAERMHRLRRGFCRSWWNPHWRDLFLVYVSWLAEGSAQIELRIGETGLLPVDAQATLFEAPIACADPLPKTALGRATSEDEEAPPEEPTESDDSGGPDDWDDDLGDQDGD